MSDQPYIRGGPIRARELRENIAEMGFERGVVHTLERFMDEYAEHRQRMRQLVELMDSCVNQIGMFMRISEGMQQRIDAMRRERDIGAQDD